MGYRMTMNKAIIILWISICIPESTLTKKCICSERTGSDKMVPEFAYTMGIKTIMQAKKILLVVSGGDKAEILKEVVYGAVTPSVPASILQMHNDVTIVADQEAARYLD